METLALDFTPALIGTIVFIVSAVLLYIISVFGVREKTYEEALEEQRKRNEASLLQSKTEKTDKGGREKKFRKPWSKRAKEKHQTDKGGSELSGNESGPHHEHVVFKPETEVIPAEFEAPASKATQKSKKNRKTSKPILVNKDEEASKKEDKGPEVHVENTAEKPRSNSFTLTKPRDEIELKNLQQVITDSAKQQSESSEVSDDNQEVQKKKVSKTDVKETGRHESGQEPKREVSTPVQSPAKKQKKAKMEVLNLTGESVSGNHLVNLLKNSILSDAEVQQLIDILLNRQQGGNSEWTRKGDPVAALKKQLQELEQALEDEQRLTQSSTVKLKEIRAESNNDKSRFSQREQQLNLKIQAQQQEIQALHNRMCHSHEQQVAETTALQNQLQQIAEDNNRFKEALSIREAEASNMQTMNHLQLELEKLQASKEQCELANDDLRCKIEQWNIAEANYKQEESAFKQHITDLTNQLNQAENNKQALIQDIGNLKSDSAVRDSKITEYQDKLSEADKTTKDLVAQSAAMKSKYDQNVTECEGLQSDVKSFKAQVTDLTNQYNTAKIEVDKLKAQIKNLNAEIETSKNAAQQNGDFNSNGHKTIEFVEHERIVQEKDRALANLKDELNMSLSKLKSNEATLNSQLEKNNELRQKNWTVMDAMAVVEKTKLTEINECNRAASEKLAETVKLEQNKCKQCLEKLFPDIRLGNKATFHEWLSGFENEALGVINQYSEQKSKESSREISSLNEKISALEEDKSSLEERAQNFKSSLIQTETILRELQDSVNESEKVWIERVQEQEKELKQAAEAKKTLLSQMSQVQASQDMQTELKDLQSKLVSEELERKALIEKCNEANEQVNNLEEKWKKAQEEAAESLKTQNKNIDDLSKELDDVKVELEKELKTNKELTAQTKKLNSLVKIGEASLKAESQLADKLREEIKQYQCEKSSRDTASMQQVQNSSMPVKEDGSSKK